MFYSHLVLFCPIKDCDFPSDADFIGHLPAIPPILCLRRPTSPKSDGFIRKALITNYQSQLDIN